MIIGLVRTLLKTATAYLDFRRETDLDQRIEGSRSRLLSMHQEIESLRNSGSERDAQRADWLRSDYKAESLHLRHLKHLRPFYSQTEKGESDSNA